MPTELMTPTVEELTDLERWGLEEGWTTLEAIARERAGLPPIPDRPQPKPVISDRWRARPDDHRDLLPELARRADASPRTAAPTYKAADDLGDEEAADDPYAGLTPAQLADVVRDHPEKFEVGEVTRTLREAAEAWLATYAGDFEWLRKQRRLLEGGYELYPATVKGVLNSWRAEMRSRATAAAPRLDTSAARPNRHAGTCIRCRANVPAGEGTILRAERGWVVLCADHSDPTAPAAQASTVAPREELPDVPGGRYAVQLPGAPLRFFRVDRPTTGKWAGYTFVAAQASDDLHPIKDPTTKAAILRAIAEDPMAAAARYGQALGVCGRCGRTLTDATSRELGIGPECRARWAA